MSNLFNTYLSKKTEAAPLAVFRILFGLMMCLSMIRFWYNGWIEKLYLKPTFFFSYYGFEWVKPLGAYTYILFIICAIASIMIAIGFKYRTATILFFLSFTYIELMDKTTYLNHYYFVSLIGFILIFIPANAYFSVDAYRNKNIRFETIPKWNKDIVKLMLGIVYFYAGLAKLNSDWLLSATPLNIWLPGSYDLPILGDLLHYTWVHYAFSWAGAIYDLTIPFLLLNKNTRWIAFFFVVVFHMLTRALFPIGMFPFIMIGSTLIFFSSDFHHKVLKTLANTFKLNKAIFDNGENYNLLNKVQLKLVSTLFIVFFAVQLLFPFRYTLYPGELFWTEEGFRFSWRVMLMEKAGSTNFKVVDNQTGNRFYVNNQDFLTSFQEKQMSFQPDFILEYAHFLKDHFESQGHENIGIYAESYVALNGRLSKQYIDPSVDLTKVKESFQHKNWILPFEDEIKGL